MDIYIIMIGRTVFLYILILVIFRVMGKREIGELSLLDLVVFMMIAEMAVIGIEDTKDPLLHTVIPMAILMVIQYCLAIVSLKSQKFREIVDGRPTVIINNGKIDEEAMKQQRYNFDDLLMQLREKSIKNVADVEFAILESSGKLSVLEKSDNQSIKDSEPSIDLPLILDGSIQEHHLDQINKTKFWLEQKLEKLGYHDIKKISYCSYHNGKFHIDLKDTR
ncbi:DUF421 domain-containing protein [Fredinandcohnia sp. SECRCQ15]|uniref:DUF421 domain-containing protein n=1 Tax=Fredinandcohnia quinoae TaxID=2918902 RepID=A0AAW5E0V0_9BACI|nr:DUF421 domain-containing protein [Fredinandcohnia sp. SECRCQ15]MCH1626536.1 DUF421 domain-containing protein [Fredinandcohnia sp. SECRCQ15]